MLSMLFGIMGMLFSIMEENIDPDDTCMSLLPNLGSYCRCHKLQC